jgi:hypothetical protein
LLYSGDSVSHSNDSHVQLVWLLRIFKSMEHFFLNKVLYVMSVEKHRMWYVIFQSSEERKNARVIYFTLPCSRQLANKHHVTLRGEKTYLSFMVSKFTSLKSLTILFKSLDSMNFVYLFTFWIFNWHIVFSCNHFIFFLEFSSSHNWKHIPSWMTFRRVFTF